MSFAFTPGLKVTKSISITKERTLPVPGDVLVKKGEMVSYDTIVAQTHVPSDVHMRPISYIVGCEPYELPNVMKFKEGDYVNKGDLLAETSSFFGLFKSQYSARYSGTIELISPISGMVAIREKPTAVNIDAFIPGKVIDVREKLGITVEINAALIQGIFGIGGERHGDIKTIAKSDEVLTTNHITADCAGKILVGGSLVTSDILKKAAEVGVKGLVVGGIKRNDLNQFLGYEIGVAITGEEPIDLTCIITEGFGEMTMAGHIYALLTSHEGDLACIDGATQIRAGVIRPEIIIPLTQTTQIEDDDASLAYGMGVGTRIRIIRQPYFGALGNISNLPIELQTVETESHVRVLEAKLDDGRTVTVPRANVEIMED
jgi:hypothetical protein